MYIFIKQPPFVCIAETPARLVWRKLSQGTWSGSVFNQGWGHQSSSKALWRQGFRGELDPPWLSQDSGCYWTVSVDTAFPLCGHRWKWHLNGRLEWCAEGCVPVTLFNLPNKVYPGVLEKSCGWLNLRFRRKNAGCIQTVKHWKQLFTLTNVLQLAWDRFSIFIRFWIMWRKHWLFSSRYIVGGLCECRICAIRYIIQTNLAHIAGSQLDCAMAVHCHRFCSSLLWTEYWECSQWGGRSLMWWPQDSVSAIWGWCVFVGIILPWSPALTGTICS